MLDGLDRSRPGDQRAFIHKKILGGISGLTRVVSRLGIPGISTAARIASGITGQIVSGGAKDLGRQLKFGNGDVGAIPGARRSTTCPSGFRLGTQGQCLTVADIGRQVPAPGLRAGIERFFPGGGTGFEPAAALVGGAVMGRYGAALEPGVMAINRAVCLRGMQLADDGLCYNKSQISNKQRMWPAGRRPLLTGGDMRAISIASRAGRRMDQTTTRLRKLGMMKKAPVTRKPPVTQHERLIEAHVAK
jgi:hypothetical protein